MDAPGTRGHPPLLSPTPNENERPLYTTADPTDMKHSRAIIFRARNTMFLRGV